MVRVAWIPQSCGWSPKGGWSGSNESRSSFETKHLLSKYLEVSIFNTQLMAERLKKLHRVGQRDNIEFSDSSGGPQNPWWQEVARDQKL